MRGEPLDFGEDKANESSLVLSAASDGKVLVSLGIFEHPGGGNFELRPDQVALLRAWLKENAPPKV